MTELERLLQQTYGQGYAPDTGGDELDYALHGPRPPVTTQDMLSTMNARQVADQRAPYEALARLFMTAMAPWASAPTGGLGANALRRSVPAVEQSAKPTAGTTPLSPRQAAMDQGQEAFNATGPTTSTGNWQEFHAPSGVNDPHALAGNAQRQVFPELYKLEKKADRTRLSDAEIMRLARLRDIYYGRPGSAGPQRTDSPFYQAVREFGWAAPPPKNRMNAVTGLPTPEGNRDDDLAALLSRYNVP